MGKGLLLHKHENSSSGLQHPRGKPSMAMCIRNFSIGLRAETKETQVLAGHQPRQNSELWVQWETLSQKLRGEPMGGSVGRHLLPT